MRNMFILIAFLSALLSRATGLPSATDILALLNGDEIVGMLDRLSAFSDSQSPAVTRIVFSEHDMKARALIKHLMEAAGLEVREDAMGNTFGRWEGHETGTAAVLSGSHTDAIPLSGKYDGTVGVIGAICAVAALRKSGFQPFRSIEIVMFTSEEPTRFHLGCIGSRGMAGLLSSDTLDSALDANGTTFAEAVSKAGLGVGNHSDILRKTFVQPGVFSHFVELHIEQGPLLERNGTDIGIVSAIAAPAMLTVEFFGDGGHAGGLLMPDRHDAGLAAMELALAVERHVLETGSIDTVGTTGSIELKPNTVNSIPRYSKLEIDIRDINGSRRDEVVQAVKESAKAIAALRNVEFSLQIINQDPPASCSLQIMKAIHSSADALKLSSSVMVSRAYHDALFMSQLAPTGMIFIPCRKGISHLPEEYASPEAICQGVAVLAMTLAHLAGESATAKSPSKHSEL